MDTEWSPKGRYHREDKHVQSAEPVKEGHDPLALLELEEWSRRRNGLKMNGFMRSKVMLVKEKWL
jgi:hypothetical protein